MLKEFILSLVTLTATSGPGLTSGEYIPLDNITPAPRDQIGPKDLPVDNPVGFQKNGWGCPWFPHVNHEDYLTRLVDKRRNHVVITWDTNGDHHYDVQFVYETTGYAAGGWIPVVEPVPKYVYLDLDNNHDYDLKLTHEGKGVECKDWRALPITKPTPQQRPNCITHNCDKKEEGES